ncbi:MAG: hypothetical protein K5648_03040 [Erysipelotrichaceae bacterium]|nr:hypothetical protein [Erysipelotrichaceae bacterium]
MIKNIELLKEETLQKIAGGTLDQGALNAVDYATSIYKRAGYSLERLKEDVTARYNSDPLLFSTDGSKEDLKELLKKYEEAWAKN